MAEKGVSCHERGEGSMNDFEKPRVGFLKQVLYGNGITAAVRIFLGFLFIFSGWFKVMDPALFKDIIIQYDIIPVPWAPWPALVLPFLELVLGVFLLLGIRVRVSAFLSALLMIFFTVIIAINLARGNTFDCGCFELHRFGLGIDESISGWLITRDVFICVGFLLVFFARHHVFSLEGLKERIRLENTE